MQEGEGHLPASQSVAEVASLVHSSGGLCDSRLSLIVFEIR